MTYDWLENVPSSITAIPTYSPDFSFLQSMQMKANQQYEQGFKEIKDSFASIFNKPVTGEEATKRQNDYKKKALDQMKAVAATDLSDPKNVMAAENIMLPFHEDGQLLQNISLTSHYQNQFQRQNSMKYSKDKDERSLYNPLVDSYLNTGLEELANTPMTADAYSKLEKRESIPVYDIDTDARDEFIKTFGKDGGIKTTDAQGNVMYVTTNGPKSVDAFKSFYLSVASRDKYTAQNRVLSTAKMELDLKDIKQRNPGISTEQATKLYGEQSVQGISKYYAGTIASYNKTALEWRQKNEALIPGGLDANGFPKDNNVQISPEVAAQVEFNKKQADQYQALSDKAQLDYSKDLGFKGNDVIKNSTNSEDYLKAVDFESDQYKKAIKDITDNPRDYVGKVYLSHAADKWAIGLASISSVEIKDSPITKAFNERADKQWEHQLKLAQLQGLNNQRDANNNFKTIESLRKAGMLTPELLEEYLPGGFDIGGDGYFNPNTGFNSNGVTNGTSGTKGLANPNIGSGTVAVTGTDIAKIPTIDLYQDEQIKTINSVNYKAFNSEGLLQMVSKDIIPGGMENTDILSLSGDLQNAITTGKYDMSKEGIARRGQFIKILNDNGLQQYTTGGLNSGPNQLRQGLMAFVTKENSEHIFQSVDPKKANLILTLAQNNLDMEKEMANYTKRETEYKEKLKDFISNDKTGIYKDLIDKKTNDFYTPENTANSFHLPTITVNELGSKSTKTITGDQFARLWNDKDLSLGLSRGTININGTEYEINNINGFDYKHSPATFPISNLSTRTPYQATHDLEAILSGKPPYHHAADGKELPYPNQLVPAINNGKSFYSVFGQPGTYKNKIAKVGEKVVGQMTEFASGVSGSAITYDMSGTGKDVNPTQKATGLAIYKEALLPGNQLKMYTVGSDKKMGALISPEMKKALEDHTATEAVLDLAESVTYHEFGPNGKPAVEVHFSGIDKGDKEKGLIGGQNVADIKKLGTMWIDVSPNAKGTYITQLPKAQMTYTYGQLLTDPTPVENNKFEESAGFKYKIMPDPNSKDANNKFTKAYIFTQHWKINPDGSVKMKNGVPEWTDEDRTPLNLLVGDRALSPDEIIQSKNRWIMTELEKRRMLVQGNQSKPPVQGGVRVGDIFK